MACNCASSEEINKLYEKYGAERKRNKNNTFSHTVRKIGVWGAMVIIMPFLFLYIIGRVIFEKEPKISFRKFFNLDGKQQSIQTQYQG